MSHRVLREETRKSSDGVSDSLRDAALWIQRTATTMWNCTENESGHARSLHQKTYTMQDNQKPPKASLVFETDIAIDK